MSDQFTIGGSPASIRNSSAVWSAFSTSSGDAASDVRSIDSGDFRGDESDLYRDKVNSDLPPHLDTTSEAWGIVAKALSTYADKLEGFQSQLASLAAQHSQDQANVSAAQSDVNNAKAADTQHDQSVQQAKAKLKPGQTLPPDTYKSSATSAGGQLSSAQQAQQQTIDAANKIQSEHSTAVDSCVSEINRAKDMRFQKPPSWWDSLTSSVCGWIKDHAGMLLKIASVLKTISSIAGILAMVPGLGEIMGPIALVTGVAAVGIEATVKLATGQGSWTSIGIDALTMTPLGGKLLGVAGKAIGKTGVGKVAITGMSKLSNGFKGAASAVKNRVGYELDIAKGGLSNVKTVMADARGIEMNGGAAAMSGGGGATLADMKGAYSTGRAQAAKNYQVEVKVDGAKYPESAQHIADAQAGQNSLGWKNDPANTKAQPDVVTIKRSGSRARGRAATSRVTRPGAQNGVKYDRDEYPPKMFAEGGKTASVKNITASDNRGAGSTMGHQLRGYPNGTKVRITPINLPSASVV